MGYETNRTPRVSVIMPVYNNGDYIRETLDSLKNQTFTDFEVICIDDGSSDNSGKIIQEYAALDPRFHYYFQENSGAGPARNNGMSKAIGKYISFLDGDDLYDPNCLSRMVEALDKTEADVCICERETFNTKNGRILYKGNKYSKFDEDRLYRTQELADRFFEIMTVFCWDKMFRRSFLQTHPYQFQNLHHCNDVCFVCSSMAAAQTVCFVTESMVRYRVGTGVSTQDKVTTQPLCCLEAFTKARENVYLLHERDKAWQKSIDTRCAAAFFKTFQNDVKDERVCKEVYDAFKSHYEIEWNFREKPLRYFDSTIIRLKMWCYRRTSYDAMRKVYLKLHGERGKKKHISDTVIPYAELIISSLLKR